MSLSARTRFEVLKRDGFACHYCGQRAPAAVLHVDHIVPRAKGGTDDQDNLLSSCATCNLGKFTSDVLRDEDGRVYVVADTFDRAFEALRLISGEPGSGEHLESICRAPPEWVTGDFPPA